MSRLMVSGLSSLRLASCSPLFDNYANLTNCVSVDREQ